jgi:hypothetical protein
MSRSEYKPTKEEILAMLKHLRHTAPEYATPEKAIFLLEQQRVHFETLEELYPELIEKILKDFESH